MEVTAQYNGYPSLVRRMQSSVIDFLLIIALMVAITQLADQFDSFPNVLRAIFFVLILLFEPLCVTFGYTLGNYLIRIRVRQYDDENKRINLFQSIIRYAIK
jgi:hypothetical protein